MERCCNVSRVGSRLRVNTSSVNWIFDTTGERVPRGATLAHSDMWVRLWVGRTEKRDGARMVIGMAGKGRISEPHKVDSRR